MWKNEHYRGVRRNPRCIFHVKKSWSFYASFEKASHDNSLSAKCISIPYAKSIFYILIFSHALSSYRIYSFFFILYFVLILLRFTSRSTAQRREKSIRKLEILCLFSGLLCENYFAAFRKRNFNRLAFNGVIDG